MEWKIIASHQNIKKTIYGMVSGFLLFFNNILQNVNEYYSIYLYILESLCNVSFTEHLYLTPIFFTTFITTILFLFTLTLRDPGFIKPIKVNEPDDVRRKCFFIFEIYINCF